MDTEKEEEEEAKEEEGEERWDDAGLAQALVGLRVRARNKAGFRVEGQKEHKWLKASGYLRLVSALKGKTKRIKDILICRTVILLILINIISYFVFYA